METDELKKFLMDLLKKEVIKRWSDSYSGFEESNPPNGEVTIETIGLWLWVKARIEYKGASWTPSTDRASGDPEDTHDWCDWIGLAESAPMKASTPEELDNWALLSTSYRRIYRDIQFPGPWGLHSGRWVENLDEDGNVKVRIVLNEKFHDVEPESTTSVENINLREISPTVYRRTYTYD